MADAARIDWGRLAILGMVGAAVIGMTEMVFEWVFGTEGFWAPMVYIGALILRGFQDVAQQPGLILAPVVVGVLLHMMMGIVLAGIFVWGASRWTTAPTPLAVAGVAYGAIVFVVMWFVALPLVNEVMLRLSAGWFFVAHLIWGLVLGLMSNRAIAEAGADVRRRRRAAGPV